MEDLLLVDQDLGPGRGFDSVGETAVVDMSVGQEDPADLLKALAQGPKAGGELVPALVAVDPGVYEDQALACVYWEAVRETDVDGLEGEEVSY
jgi:hypothetical protein